MPPNSAQPAPDRTRERGEIWIRVRSHARWFDTPSGCAGPDRKAPLSGCAGPRSRPGDRGSESCSLPATSPLRTRLPSPFATGTDLLVRVPARWDDAEPQSRPPPKRRTKVRATTPRLRLMPGDDDPAASFCEGQCRRAAGFGRAPSRNGSGRCSAAALLISSASPASSSWSRSSSCSAAKSCAVTLLGSSGPANGLKFTTRIVGCCCSRTT